MKLFLIILIIIVLLGTAVVYESRRELHMLRMTRYSIKSRNVPVSLKGKSLVFLSDYHEACDGELNAEIVSKIDSVKPAAVLLGGDMINGKNPMEDIHPAADLINSIAEKYSVYYAFGNHEKKVKEDYYDTKQLWGEFTENLHGKITFLLNEGVDLGSIGLGNVTLYGLDIPLEFYQRLSYPDLDAYRISGFMGKRKPGEYAILLGHAPDFIKGYEGWGADLVLSGHFHGGLVRIPVLGGAISPRLRLFPKYDYGRFDVGATTMIVTNGLGQHSLKIRIGNIPEIVVIDFK
jgi:hypothetical protein